MNKEDKIDGLMVSKVPVPSWWTSSEKQIQEVINNEILKGEVKVLSVSPGGREVKSVSYGEAEPELKGTANYNSALAARSADLFFRRGSGVRRRPVLVVLAGVHGHEVEGMMAAISIIKLMETGRDIMNNENPTLLEKLQRLRLVIIPVANPDGRARVPYDGWVGLPRDEKTKYGQGTRTNGEMYGWPGCKAVHPMKGDVGILGGYFDDNGINLMHDEWSSPMSNTSKAILELARDEGPNMLINMHSHRSEPTILPIHYVPISTKKRIESLRGMFEDKLKAKNYFSNLPDMLTLEGAESATPPAFNLTSMLYHVGADLSFTYENPHGFIDYENAYNYQDFINIQHILFETAADYLLGDIL